jgi:hypothetical protein
MPVVMVSVPSGVSAGNILRGGLVEKLLNARSDVHVVVVSPLVQDKTFVREFDRPHVTFERLPPHVPSGIEARLMALIQACYLESGVTASVKIRREEAISNGTIRWIRTKRQLARIVAPSMLRKETRYTVIDRVVEHPWAERLFDQHRPVLVVGSSPGLIFAEVPVLRTAARRGVRTIVVDPSWDNFTNKLVPVRRVDRLVVWNDIMKEQAVTLHGYRPEQIRTSGPPHWDRYFQTSPNGTRDAFFRQVGLDPARRLITITTTPAALYSHFDHVIRVLLRAIDGNCWGLDAQLLVRLHPRDDLERYDGFRGAPHIVIEKPFKATVRAGDGLNVDITEDNQRHLADTLRYSDVIVTVASTIGIEAAIFDTPVVDVSFDGEAPSEFVRSARRYYQFTHYANVLRHGGGRVAATPDQLIEYVGQYLADPSLNREARRHVVLDQCQFVDGRSSERIAQFVIAELDAVCSKLPAGSV